MMRRDEPKGDGARPFAARAARSALCLALFLAIAGCGGALKNPVPVPAMHTLEAVLRLTREPAPTASPAPTPSPEPTPLPREEIVVSLLGDCTLGGDPRIGQLDAFRGVLAQEEGDYGYFFEHALPYTGKDDLTVVNLEGPLTQREAGAEKEFAFRGDPAFARILSQGGVEAVSLANNHALDFGQGGYDDTLEALLGEGVAACDIAAPALCRAGAYSVGIAASKFPTDERMDQLRADITQLKEEGALLVVAVMHWNEEGSTAPTPAIRAYAHEAVDAGADLVVGHHPHILQGIEIYRGRTIAYSLGNFVFGGNRNPSERETALLQQRFLIEDGAALPDGFRLVPFAVSGVASGNDYRPVELTGEAAQKVFDLVNRRGALFPDSAQVVPGWNGTDEP